MYEKIIIFIILATKFEKQMTLAIPVRMYHINETFGTLVSNNVSNSYSNNESSGPSRDLALR